MTFFRKFPDQKALLEMYPTIEPLKVNAHVHTPYSFSAFSDIAQIFYMAQKEHIAAVGINDFFVTDGFEVFYDEALKTLIFPLFNIEFIGLLKKEQREGIRINDPGNPGRCYFCGKGMRYPFQVNQQSTEKLRGIVAESQLQIKAMINLANAWFVSCGSEIELSYDTIRERYAHELVRERHIAKAIRIAVLEKYNDRISQLEHFIRILGGKPPLADLTDIPGLENEIRSSLLKSGGKAFVEEDETAFMSLDEIMVIILDAGGIPCYPVLLDDKSGSYTEFEKDPERLYRELTSRNIGCIELIPGRNDADQLDGFVRFFHRKGFIILLGTEHNTPEMIPLTCDTRGHQPLSETLHGISYEGACVVAAHQYLMANDQPGFTHSFGMGENDRRNTFVKLGNAVIHYFQNNFKTC